MKAFVFPGQGAQFPGMGRELYESNKQIKSMFQDADKVLGFPLSEQMFNGTAEELKQTKVTQPAVFLHSVAAYISQSEDADMVAGHSLGEFSALVAAKALSVEDALILVSQRAQAMQRACELEKSTMAAVLGLEDDQVEEICNALDEVVVAANYNCPGQLVISGSLKGVELASAELNEAGARRVLPLQVGGAFHSPLMEPARKDLARAIQDCNFNDAACPIYQNVTAKPAHKASDIKENLVKQLTAPVKWTQSMQNMLADGATEFIECGPGKVLQGLVKKVDRQMETKGIS